MRAMVMMVMLLVSCATAPVTSPSSYEELATCPSTMTQEQASSGAVRCQALCASYGRDYADFDSACRCVCAPKPGSVRAWGSET